jgi:hypothetical protein
MGSAASPLPNPGEAFENASDRAAEISSKVAPPASAKDRNARAIARHRICSKEITMKPFRSHTITK